MRRVPRCFALKGFHRRYIRPRLTRRLYYDYDIYYLSMTYTMTSTNAARYYDLYYMAYTKTYTKTYDL
jgi:hypothetical protein